MMRVLVTGATGFFGRHLVACLQEAGCDVVAADASVCPTGHGVTSIQLDVCDRRAMRGVIARDIEIIFHLAFSRVRPAHMTLTALEGTAAVLEEAAQARRPPRVVLASSGAVYGWASNRSPLTEEAPTAPATFYGVVKLAQEHLAAGYARTGALHVVIVRPFNLVGPGEDGTLVTGALALQIARGERAGRRFEVRAGNLEAYRDFVDIRDAARAFVAAGHSGASGEVFNVCTGRAVQIKAVLDPLRRAARAPFDVVSHAAGGGPDIPYQVGSAARLQARTAWTPWFALDQSLNDLLDDMRDRVKADAA